MPSHETQTSSSQASWPIVDIDARGDERLYFTDDEWTLLDAVTARIIPTTETPGAREANVVRFLDRLLSGIAFIYAAADGHGFLELRGLEAAAWTAQIAGYRERYRELFVAVAKVSNERFQKPFPELHDTEQDDVLYCVQSGTGDGPTTNLDDITDGPVANEPVDEDHLDFFKLLIMHTRQGFYADPVYGGNTDHVGWKAIGFPGPASLADTRNGYYTTTEYLP